MHENDPANLGLQVLIEGLFLGDPAEAQRCLASFAYRHLADGSYAGRVGRRSEGDWTVELAGEEGRWLVLLPVTRRCNDIDDVHWEVFVRDAHGDILPSASRTESSGRPEDGSLLTEHLGLDPSLVDDLVELALSTSGVTRLFRPLMAESVSA